MESTQITELLKSIIHTLLDDHIIDSQKATEVMERLENRTYILVLKPSSSYRDMCAIMPAYIVEGKMELRYVLRLVDEDNAVFPSKNIIHELCHFIAITNRQYANGLICKWGLCCNLYQIQQGKVKTLSLNARYSENEKANCIATDYVIKRLQGQYDGQNISFLRNYFAGRL